MEKRYKLNNIIKYYIIARISVLNKNIYYSEIILTRV